VSPALEFSGVVTGGHLPGRVRDSIAAAVAGMEGKRVVVTVKAQEKRRSLSQSRFYQGPFIEAFRQCLLSCGQRVSHDDIHAGLRDAYAKNGYCFALPDGQAFRVPPSTARLSTVDFEGYLEEIRAHFAGEYGWQLPLPNETTAGRDAGEAEPPNAATTSHQQPLQGERP
jgi:hypothetical protein